MGLFENVIFKLLFFILNVFIVIRLVVEVTCGEALREWVVGSGGCV